MLIAAVGTLAYTNSPTKQNATSASNLSSLNLAAGESQEPANPIDQISAADIAVNVARATSLPESTSVTNKADSENATLAVSSTDDSIVSKPQVISEGLKSKKDIIHYKTVKGDTVPKLAKKFGITPQTIHLSNNLEGDGLNKGMNLVISPVNGLVYRIQPGDTPESVATKFRADLDQVVAINDVELTGKFKEGELIVVPEGVNPSEPRYSYQVETDGAPVASTPSFSFGSNSYDYGWCTYYAAARSGAPGGWGNAATWHIYAPLAGWTVSNVPKPGAIAQTSSGWAGHVGIVEDVRKVGGQYEIKYSDMNGLAGFNAVGYSDWVSANGQFQRFIYP